MSILIKPKLICIQQLKCLLVAVLITTTPACQKQDSVQVEQPEPQNAKQAEPKLKRVTAVEPGSLTGVVVIKDERHNCEYVWIAAGVIIWRGEEIIGYIPPPKQ